MSGSRRRAWLEVGGVVREMREFRIGGDGKEMIGLRQPQQRRSGEHRRAGERHHGADGADVVRMRVGGVVIVGPLRVRPGCRLIVIDLVVTGLGSIGPGSIGFGLIGSGLIGLAGRNRRSRGCRGRARLRRCVRGIRMEMSERQHELHRQREQRQPNSMPQSRSKPLHRGMRPTSRSAARRTLLQML